MASESQVLVFLLVTLLQCISKANTGFYFLTSFVYFMSAVISELRVDTLCLYFKLRHLIKQFPILYCLSIMSLINVLSPDYFMYLLLLCFNMEI